MKVQTRRRAILDIVRRRGMVSLDVLARELDVSTQTIRRDIDALYDEDLLVRQHGVVGLPSSVINIDYAVRKISHRAAKTAIAQAIADYLPEQASIFMSVGTTMESVAQALAQRSGLQVITNNLHVAATLHPHRGIKTQVAGGTIRRHNGGIVGATAVEFVERFRADFAILGVGAISPDGTLLDYDINEVGVAQAMLRCARRVLIAADHTKFMRSATVLIGGASQIDALFTDRIPPKPLAGHLARHKVEVHIVNDSTGPDRPTAPGAEQFTEDNTCT